MAELTEAEAANELMRLAREMFRGERGVVIARCTNA